jgi:anti-sigma B factor antagonist
MDSIELVTVQVEQLADPPVAIIRVKGELDFATTPRLVEALAQLPAAANLIFDFSELQFCDSSGLGALIAAYKTASATGAKAYLAGLTPTVLTAIKVTMLDELFPIRDTAQAALAEVSAS